jgi:hypothetical protein
MGGIGVKCLNQNKDDIFESSIKLKNSKITIDDLKKLFNPIIVYKNKIGKENTFFKNNLHLTFCTSYSLNDMYKLVDTNKSIPFYLNDEGIFITYLLSVKYSKYLNNKDHE